MNISSGEKINHEVSFMFQKEGELPELVDFNFIGTDSSFAQFMQNLRRRLNASYRYSDLITTKVLPPNACLLFGYW